MPDHAEGLRRYAAAALAVEDARSALAAADRVEQGLCAMVPDGVDFPVSLSMPDGRVVTIDTLLEPDNYCLTYTVSELIEEKR